MSRLISWLLFALMVVSGRGACPSIISRRGWGARTPRRVTAMTTPVQYAIIHHGTGSNCNNQASCKRLVRSYQNYHMDNRRWPDIGYNFVIGGDGSVFEGRGWDKGGAHARGYNSDSLGICLTGDFTNELPPQAQLDALKDLLTCGVSRGKLQSLYKLKGHRDVGNTQCPGNRLYQKIRTWSRYTA